MILKTKSAEISDEALGCQVIFSDTESQFDKNKPRRSFWIDHAENKIDELVYELYGLSGEEIEIVEK